MRLYSKKCKFLIFLSDMVTRMALRSAPARELQLDDIYIKPERGAIGVRAYVFARLGKGDEVKDILADFAAWHSIVVPDKTFYAWLKRWRCEQEAQQTPTKPTRRRRKAKTEAVVDVEGAAA